MKGIPIISDSILSKIIYALNTHLKLLLSENFNSCFYFIDDIKEVGKKILVDLRIKLKCNHL